MAHARASARVLHVLPSDHARGAQVYARALCDELGGVAAGHRVVVLFDGPRLAASADDELGVPNSPFRGYGLDPRAATRLWQLVRRTGPEIVLAHGAEAIKYAAPLTAMRHRPRIVLYSIGVALPKARRPSVRAAYSGLFRVADTVACVSPEVVEDCAELFRVPRQRLRYVPNGRALPPASTMPAAAPDDSAAEPAVAFVGHLTESKRPADYLEVVSRLRADGFAGRAWMAGDGPLLEPMRRLGPGSGVEVLGRRDDVPSLLAAAEVMCFTSIPDGEGMPGVLIEAGFAGVPVVATAVPGTSSVIEDGVTGIVVPVGDLDALTAAVRRLIGDPALRRRMGAAARARCETHFSLAASAQIWRELFAEVTSTPVSGW
jgi:glycosyltransferase involved in cell wall biosynthesis